MDANTKRRHRLLRKLALHKWPSHNMLNIGVARNADTTHPLVSKRAHSMPTLSVQTLSGQTRQDGQRSRDERTQLARRRRSSVKSRGRLRPHETAELLAARPC